MTKGPDLEDHRLVAESGLGGLGGD